MPDQGDAEILQILGRQARQYPCVDLVHAERLLVLLQPETVEPCRNVHARILNAVTATLVYRTPNCRCPRILSAACRRPTSRVHHAAIAMESALLVPEHYPAACRERHADPVLARPYNFGLGSSALVDRRSRLLRSTYDTNRGCGSTGTSAQCQIAVERSESTGNLTRQLGET